MCFVVGKKSKGANVSTQKRAAEKTEAGTGVYAQGHLLGWARCPVASSAGPARTWHSQGLSFVLGLAEAVVSPGTPIPQPSGEGPMSTLHEAFSQGTVTHTQV